jgi:hypothetical protein
MNPYPFKVEQQMQEFYHSLSEKERRRYAAIEAVKLGWGGMTYISQLLGYAYYTIRFGIEELDDQSAMNRKRIRRPGGGRKSALENNQELESAFFRVIVQYTAGSPMDEQVKWTNLTRQEIAQLLQDEGITVSVTVVDQLLEKHNYRKRKAQKRVATGLHPQRNQQFEKIEQLKHSYKEASNPVLSMDTKKKN